LTFPTHLDAKQNVETKMTFIQINYINEFWIFLELMCLKHLAGEAYLLFYLETIRLLVNQK